MFRNVSKTCNRKNHFLTSINSIILGHLLANESVEDGQREGKEELKSDISNEQLKYLGIFLVKVKLLHFLTMNLLIFYCGDLHTFSRICGERK